MGIRARSPPRNNQSRAWQSGEIQDKDSNRWLQLPSRSSSSQPLVYRVILLSSRKSMAWPCICICMRGLTALPQKLWLSE